MVGRFGLGLALIGCILLYVAPTTSRAADGWDHAILQLAEENDSGLSDRHYTQGAYVRLLSADHTNQNWLTTHVPSVGYDAARWKWGGDFGQQMFTPEDIARHDLIPEDRPYAGWLYGGLIYQPRGETTHGTPLMETYRVQVGVVGPASQANDAQIAWHHYWGFPRPNGWKNQINNEVGVQLGYDRRHRYAVGDLWSAQLLPEAGLSLGNIRIDAHAGVTLRAGYNIPDEFGGGTTNQSGWDWGAYVFGGVKGSAVALDIFLDGNNFTESHHVNKEPLVGDIRIGGAIAVRYMEVMLMHVKRSREFEAQGVADGFTSLTLTMKF